MELKFHLIYLRTPVRFMAFVSVLEHVVHPWFVCYLAWALQYAIYFMVIRLLDMNSSLSMQMMFLCVCSNRENGYLKTTYPLYVDAWVLDHIWIKEYELWLSFSDKKIYIWRIWDKNERKIEVDTKSIFLPKTCKMDLKL